MLKIFSNAIGRLSVFLGKSCGVFYLAAIALSAYEVFMRYVLDAPTAWTSETIMALCATAWLLCAGAVTQQHRHITVTVMEMLVGAALWRRMAKLALLLSALAVAGLLYCAWDPMIAAINSVQRSGSAFDPPTPTYLKTMLVIAGALYLLQILANLVAPSDHSHDRGTSHADLVVDDDPDR